MSLAKHWFAPLLVIAALAAAGCGYSAAAEDAGAPPATVENDDDSDAGRVILSPSAAKRIGLQTAAVARVSTERSLVVVGRVITAGGTTWVRLPAGQSLHAVDGTKPARILRPSTDAIVVTPAGQPPTGAADGLYYRLPAGAGLSSGRRLRVELSLRDGAAQTMIPYSAVIYWTDGRSWTYVTIKPLTYVRQPVVVDHVEGNMAVLSSGPPAGTQVVSVGGAELLGTEFEIEGE